MRKVERRLVRFFHNKLKALWQEGVDFSVLWDVDGKGVRIRLLTLDFHLLSREDEVFAQIVNGAKELDGVKIERVDGIRETALIFKVA